MLSLVADSLTTQKRCLLVVFFEDLLRAIAMVHIEVHNHHPAKRSLLYRLQSLGFSYEQIAFHFRTVAGKAKSAQNLREQQRSSATHFSSELMPRRLATHGVANFCRQAAPEHSQSASSIVN